MTPIKVFFGNYKGGVGKTTTVYEIGALLARDHQKRVLLIDLDPQCSLTKICYNGSGLSPSTLKVEETFNYCVELYSEIIQNVSKIEILQNNINSKYNVIKNTIRTVNKFSRNGGKLDFIPTVLNMKNARLNDISDRLSTNKKNILVISTILSDINQIAEEENYKYDYILFDCPPTSNLLIQGVFLASDYYLIPTVGDEISTDGVADYITEIEGTFLKYVYDDNIGGLIIKMYFGDKPNLIGVLETMYKNRKPSPANLSVLENLDKAINKIGVTSLISNTNLVRSGYNNIFHQCIRHLDNRSNPSNYGMPITLSNGDIHDEYATIAEYISTIS